VTPADPNKTSDTSDPRLALVCVIIGQCDIITPLYFPDSELTQWQRERGAREGSRSGRNFAGGGI